MGFLADKNIGNIEQLYSYPRMVPILQRFDDDHLANPVQTLIAELQKPEITRQLDSIKQGDHIAIGCGSRGITNIVPLLQTLVLQLKQRGALPFVFPAMGSHGGGTAEGQREILSGYGITESNIGAPIRCTMDTVCIGYTEDGRATYLDAIAVQADHIVAINRVSAHTAFQGPYESGIVKMMVIGMGKMRGAQTYHRNGFGAMATDIPKFGNVVLRNAPILFGIGLIENAYKQTCRIAVLPPSEILSEEPKLLLYAKKRKGKLLFDSCDVLIVDYLGKDISGEGMDPHVTGRFPTSLCTSTFTAQKLVVLDISKDSHRNCYGVGLADVTTRRLLEHSDLHIMYLNARTNTVLDGVKIPMICSNHQQAIQAAIETCICQDPSRIRIIRIKNTREIDTILVSESMLDCVHGNDALEVLDTHSDFNFNEDGNLF
nr:lactate racemase domain-containing protein [uncultured Sphaerochaeta sp.]